MESGTGKTVTSLSFPNPAVIDTEKGTKHYGKYFDFYVIETSDPKKISTAIEELIDNPGGFKTLVIDPFTPVYEKIVDNHLNRLKIKSGNSAYQLQPKDYKPIRAEIKNMIDKLLALDMNIIVTARSSTLYSQEEFMKIIGTKADGPKDLPYLFDIVLELTKETKDDKDVFIAHNRKDRTNTLPKTFEFSYQSFVSYVGIDGLEREPVVFNQKAKLNENVGRTNEIVYNKQKIKTAGITAAQLTEIEKLVSKSNREDIENMLKDDYYVSSFLDLKESEADLFIKDLKTNQSK